MFPLSGILSFFHSARVKELVRAKHLLLDIDKTQLRVAYQLTTDCLWLKRVKSVQTSNRDVLYRNDCRRTGDAFLSNHCRQSLMC
jgi:hypothetical protein